MSSATSPPGVSQAGGGLRLIATLVAIEVSETIVTAVATYPLASPWLHDHFPSGDVTGRLGRLVAGLGSVVFLTACGSTTAARKRRRRRRPPPLIGRRREPIRRGSRWVAEGPPGPVPGYVLIADRNNNRILLVSPAKHVVWRFDALRGPDDAFFTPGWRSIITNEEFNDTLREVALKTRRIVWRTATRACRGQVPAI